MIPVRNPDYILFNNRTLIEFLGDVVARSSNQLHSPFEGSMIGSRSDEGGEKRVVHVDDAPRKVTQHCRRKHLHIACEYNQINPLALQQIYLLAFGENP